MRQMTKLIYLMLGTAALSGCVVQEISLHSQYNPSEVSWHKASGTGQIKGSALIRQNGGGVVTCAGNEVSATPSSSYARERMTGIYGNQSKGYRPIVQQYKFDQPIDQNYLIDSFTTTCDAQGYFTFTNLADGQYFVTTSVVWRVGYGTQGGFLMHRVTIEDGNLVEVVLSP